MKPSEAFALDTWLSYYPENMTYEEIIDAMTDLGKALRLVNIDVWEIVEDYDYPYVAQLIEDSKVHFEQTAKLVLANYKTALQELLEYTGGWDITNEEHPIYKARMALKKEQTI